jgi:lysyl-tRNA synthetase class 2
MLELYQAYGDYTDMMSIFEDVVGGTAEELFGTTVLSYQGREIDLTPPWRRATLEELVLEHAGVEVSLSMGIDELRRIAASRGVPFETWYGPGKLILEIYEKTTEAELWGPVFVCDYPQEVSPLARAHRSKPGYVERFEPIIAGRELGNAFSELTDPDDQRARFEDQERERALGDDEAMAIDWDYLRALELGLPPTGGLGLGIDRLVMLYADVANIREVVLFPALRPEERSGETSDGSPAGGGSDS